jgi:hypothetical protein
VTPISSTRGALASRAIQRLRAPAASPIFWWEVTLKFRALQKVRSATSVSVQSNRAGVDGTAKGLSGVLA